MDTIRSKTPNIFHSTKQCINDHQYVKFWYDNRNSFDYKVRAYIVRDYCYFPDKTVKELFDRYCKKVGILVDNKTRINRQKRDFAKHMSILIMNDNFDKDLTISNMYEQFVQENRHYYIGDERRYNIISNMIDGNASLYQIYNQFTDKELDCIGW